MPSEQDIAGSLDAEVSTAPAPRLTPPVPMLHVSREIAEAVVERLNTLSGAASSGHGAVDEPERAAAANGGRVPSRRRPQATERLFALRELLQFDL